MAVKPNLNAIGLDNNGDIRPTQWEPQEERQRQEQRQERKRWLNHEINRLNLEIKDLEKQIQEYETMKGSLQEAVDYLQEAKNGTINLQELIPAAYSGNSSGGYVKSAETSHTGIVLNIAKINYVISDINKIIYDLKKNIEEIKTQIGKLKKELNSL